MRTRLMQILFTVFILSVQLSCAQDTRSEAAQRTADEKKLQEYFTVHNIHAQKASGIYYTISRAGTGHKILAGETVTIDYTGKLLDGTVFDSNTDPKFQHPEPLTVEIGAGKVIKGWDKGVQLLQKGSVATLYIPSGMAYGAANKGPIPANSILVFDVAVTDVTK
ncbi:MAG: FKBP-type peptidyl-prolyl cis-trans isomerase [Chitinophagales bacterium]